MVCPTLINTLTNIFYNIPVNRHHYTFISDHLHHASFESLESKAGVAPVSLSQLNHSGLDEGKAYRCDLIEILLLIAVFCRDAKRSPTR